MKRILILLLFIVSILASNAQIKKTIITRPNISKSRVDSVMMRQQPDLRRDVGKDLKIVLTSIEKSGSNFAIGSAGIYTINFEMINSGSENVNVGGVGIQSYLNNAAGNFSSPVGGYVLNAGVPNFPEKAILHPGEKYQGKFVANGYNPADNNGNKFVIKIDHNNTIAEINEANNTLEIPVIGNLESWSTPLPDLTFQVSSIAPVTGSSYLNTSLDISLVNIGAGEIPADVVNKIIPMVQVYPVGSSGTNLYNEVFFLGTRVVGNQTYPGYNTTNAPLKPGGKIRLGGSVHVNGLTSGATVVFHFTISIVNNEALPEINTTNNTIDFLYTVK